MLNPIIFRLLNKNDFIFKLTENKFIDFKVFSTIHNEIQNFISWFFQKYGLYICNFKLFIKIENLSIFINYNSHKFYYFYPLNFKLLQKDSILNSLNSNFLILNFRLHNLNTCLKKIIFKNISNIIFFKYYFLFFQFVSFYSVFNRIKPLKFMYFIKTKYYNIRQNNFINNFISILILTLKYFLNTSTTIFIIFKQINKNINFKYYSKILKQQIILYILKLRKFKTSQFFKLNLNYILIILHLQFNIFIIAELLKINFNNLKTITVNSTFVRFLKISLYYILILSAIRGIKFVLKGNLTKNQRASKIRFFIGNQPNNIKLNTTFNFIQSTCFTKKGTIGIKIYSNYDY